MAWSVREFGPVGTASAARPNPYDDEFSAGQQLLEPVPPQLSSKRSDGTAGTSSQITQSWVGDVLQVGRTFGYTIHSGCWKRSGSHFFVRSAGITMMERRTEPTTARCWDTLNRCQRSNISS